MESQAQNKIVLRIRPPHWQHTYMAEVHKVVPKTHRFGVCTNLQENNGHGLHLFRGGRLCQYCSGVIYASMKHQINIYVATSFFPELIRFAQMSTNEHYFSFLNRAIVAAMKQCDWVRYLRFSGPAACPASQVIKACLVSPI